MTRLTLSLAIGMVLMFPPSTTAMTYVLVSDEQLTDQADLIAYVEVSQKSISSEDGGVTTQHSATVLRTLKGYAPGSQIEVRVPGGIDLERGVAMKIFGAPEFRSRENALLFLRARPDGSYRILHLIQGVFRPATFDGESVFVRDLSEASQAVVLERSDVGNRPGSVLQFRTTPDIRRQRDRFFTWLEDRSRGIRRDPDYIVEAPEDARSQYVASFTHLGSGINFRWFKIDRDKRIGWYRHVDGQADVPGGGGAEFSRALKAWKKKSSGVRVRLKNRGTTTATGGFRASDTKNTLLHSDLNDTIGEDFECDSGGILAIGGVSSFDIIPKSWKDLPFLEAHEADIVVNDNISCFLSENPGSLEQIYAHELGHTLGLGHSCGDSSSPRCSKSPLLAAALMRAQLRNVVGARLGDDDILGFRQLYLENFWAAACESAVPGGKKFCRRCGPCGEGQGHCRGNSDCFGDLVCAQNVGGQFGFNPTTNVCVQDP
jgi:hypothetical protein